MTLYRIILIFFYDLALRTFKLAYVEARKIKKMRVKAVCEGGL